MLDYLKNILTLSVGTLVSQIILILSVPFLTRIYSPSDLGVTALYLAIATILSSFATGKYDLAIFLPKNNIWIINLFFGTIIINIIIFLLMIVAIIPVNILMGNSIPYDLVWIFTIPCLFLLNGLNASTISLLNKHKLYTYISISRIFKNIILSLLSVLTGFIFYDPIYMILSHVFSLIFVNLLLIYIVFKYKLVNLKIFSYKRIFILLKKYYHFPLYSLPASFINILSNQAPIIMLSFYFGAPISGMYSLVSRVLGVPSKLISGATSEVFRQKASEEYNLNNNCQTLYIKTFKALFLVSLIPFSILILFGPSIFSFIFGGSWVEAGYYARYLSLFYILRFCISPLGFTLIISNRQNYNLYWQIILLILSNLGLYIGYYLNSVDYSIILFSLFYSIMYLFYFKESYKSSKGNLL